MPTISQLPTITSILAADEIPISHGGSACATTVGALLASAQPAIIIQSPALLGRTSIGSGAPEQINVGPGMALSGGTIAANGADHATYPSVPSIALGADLVISNQGSPMLMQAELLRALFSAGDNVAIDGNGVISATTSGTLYSGGDVGNSISTLQAVSSIAAQDLVPVSQSGVDYAISYADFVNGITIDEAPAAVPASGSDTMWVGQGTNVMARQTLTAIWVWLASQIPTYKAPVIEIIQSCNLDTTVHNGRVLVCSQPVTLTPLSTNMGSGFACSIVNLSSGNVTLGIGFVTSTGNLSLAPQQSASVQCLSYSGGTVVYATLSQTTATINAPGQVMQLVTSALTSNSVTLTWQAPPTGGSPTAYIVQYRVTGSGSWSIAASANTATTLQVSGLQPSTSYDFEVQAYNAGGAGAFSQIVSASTIVLSAPVQTPAQVMGVTATPASTTSLQITWSSQTGTNAATSYTVQYRPTGTPAWTSVTNISAVSYLLSGLQPSTSYDVSIIGVDSAGAGPASSSISVSTQTVSAPPQVTGVAVTTTSFQSVSLSWTSQTGANSASSYTIQYRTTGSATWITSASGIAATTYTVSGLQATTSYDFIVIGTSSGGSGPASAVITVATAAPGNAVSAISWNVGPSGSYTASSGSIGVNAHVTPSSASIQFGFSTSSTVPPISWTAGVLVNSNLWGAYVPSPATAGNWYAWVEGTDGSSPTVFATPFTVQAG